MNIADMTSLSVSSSVESNISIYVGSGFKRTPGRGTAKDS